MSKEWNAAIAAAEATAQQKQAAEDMAQARFDALRAEYEATGRLAQLTASPEFKDWIAARHASDEAWGAWAMTMDAKPAS